MNLQHLNKAAKNGGLSAFFVLIGTAIIVNAVGGAHFPTSDVSWYGVLFVVVGWLSIIAGFVMGIRAVYFAIGSYFSEGGYNCHESNN